GAFTGQVSVSQISAFATWCIVGHSETRVMTGASDELVAQKAELLLRHGITPIVCIGETEDERRADETVAKISRQIHSLLAVLPRVAFLKTVIAYEPIWAIGTGFTPQPDDVAEIMLLIRKMTQYRFDSQAAQRLRILYGGSVKPENVAQYVGGPYADGVLVGGASVHAGQFMQIAKVVSSSR
ncbi:MAG: triosephosphate isomerase, partial [Candidatus Sungbacteria bacterium]|nr:triosephosphate isomerase [Candidatus Sungbacteria bacterium]